MTSCSFLLAVVIVQEDPEGWGLRRLRVVAAACSVQGDISHPRSISVQVWAIQSQRLTVTWGDLCAAGFTSGVRSGQFTVTAGAGLKVTRRVPLAAGHAGKCTPNVLVSLGSAGRLHVYLSGRH